MKLTRQEFLRTAMLGAAGLTFGCSGGPAGSAGPPGSGPFDVAVVGAGIAGLAAADTLMRAGLRVAVLEAQGHRGGRTVSDNTTFPVHPVDLGAQFFHQADESPLVGIANSMGFQTPPYNPTPVVLDTFAGTLQPDDAATLAFLLNVSALEPVALERAAAILRNEAVDLSIQALAEEAGLTGFGYGFTSRILCTITEGKPAQECSVLDVAQSAMRGAKAHDDRLNLGGMGNFVAQLYQGIPVSLNSGVRSISWGGSSGVRLDTPQGLVEARAVVVTVPLGALARGTPSFDPVLPPEYLLALDELPMGFLDKIFLGFDADVFGGLEPNSLILPDPDDPNGPTIVARLYGENLALIFTGGDLSRTLEPLGDAAMIDYGVGLMRDSFGPAAADAFDRGLAKRWGADAFTFGCYTAADVGGAPARQQLAIPLARRIYFAGEAVSRLSHSTVLGAWESGIAAARRILAGGGGAT